MYRSTHEGAPAEPTCQPCRRERNKRTCEYCGTEFVAQPNKTGRYHCSREHFELAHYLSPEEAGRRYKAARKAKVRERKARRRLTWDGISDEQIFERDCWRCQICGWNLFRDEVSPHPASPSVDHIVPLSRGGSDTAKNKRAAHLFCNVKRRNKMTPEEEAVGEKIADVVPRVRKRLEYLPWPKVLYSRSCRWCGVVVTSTRPSRSAVTVCAECSHGKCSSCGGEMFVVVSSLPPERRLCHVCRADRRGLPRTPRSDEGLWWTNVRPDN